MGEGEGGGVEKVKVKGEGRGKREGERGGRMEKEVRGVEGGIALHHTY